ncbi:MAG: endo-1,4-beta-xylanase [Litorimonas sp.]
MRHFTARDRLKLLAGGAAALVAGCGGGSGGASTPTPPVVVTPPPTPPPTTFVPEVGQFKNTFATNFQIGAAIQDNQIVDTSDDVQILKDQFNSITAEYQMKPDIIAPSEGVFDWSVPDALVQFAEDNGMVVRGHALLWHLSTPDYFLQGTPAEVRARLENYVTEVVTRYKGRVFAWDVVNEVITDDDSATDPYRRSNWWDASGGNADYIDWAFNAARAADPECLLFINEYSTRFSGKRGRYIEVIRDLVNRGVPIDGVGHQMHLNVETQASDALAAIDAIDNEFMGLEQHVTELDISLYPDPGSCFVDQTGCRTDYGANIPDSILTSQAELYRALFNGFTERPSIASVSLWGVSDAQSWLNDVPIARTNAPLLWDRNRDAKSALQAILDPDFTP